MTGCCWWAFPNSRTTLHCIEHPGKKVAQLFQDALESWFQTQESLVYWDWMHTFHHAAPPNNPLPFVPTKLEWLHLHTGQNLCILSRWNEGRAPILDAKQLCIPLIGESQAEECELPLHLSLTKVSSWASASACLFMCYTVLCDHYDKLVIHSIVSYGDFTLTCSLVKLRCKNWSHNQG